MRSIIRTGLVLGTIAALSGCGATDLATQVTEDGQALATQVTEDGQALATQVAEGVSGLTDTTLSELQAQLPSIEQAVAAGNIEEARGIFSGVNTIWEQIRDAAQLVAPDTSLQIQNSMDQLRTILVDTQVPDLELVRETIGDLQLRLEQLMGSI